MLDKQCKQVKKDLKKANKLLAVRDKLIASFKAKEAGGQSNKGQVKKLRVEHRAAMKAKNQEIKDLQSEMTPAMLRLNGDASPTLPYPTRTLPCPFRHIGGDQPAADGAFHRAYVRRQQKESAGHADPVDDAVSRHQGEDRGEGPASAAEGDPDETGAVLHVAYVCTGMCNAGASPHPVSVQIAFLSHWQLSHSRNPVSRKMQETMTWYTTNSVMVYNETSNTAELIPALKNIGGIKLFGFASSYRMKVRSRQWKHEKG